MRNLYDFYKSLTPGDVITTVGVKGVSKKDEEELTYNRLHHEGWNKYARITSTHPSERCAQTAEDGGTEDLVVGVEWEGIDPSVKDGFGHFAYKSDPDPVKVRKTTKTEHRAFVEEYLKTRIEIIDHKTEEIANTKKKLVRERKQLSAIASKERIDTDKLLKKRKP